MSAEAEYESTGAFNLMYLSTSQEEQSPRCEVGWWALLLCLLQCLRWCPVGRRHNLQFSLRLQRPKSQTGLNFRLKSLMYSPTRNGTKGKSAESVVSSCSNTGGLVENESGKQSVF